MSTRKKIPNPYTQVGGGIPQIEYAETQQEEGVNETRTERETEKPTERENDKSTARTERATIEVSLYLTPSLDEKLEDLRREYKRKTGKRIMPNKIMRILIKKATIDDLLTESEE